MFGPSSQPPAASVKSGNKIKVQISQGYFLLHRNICFVHLNICISNSYSPSAGVLPLTVQIAIERCLISLVLCSVLEEDGVNRNEPLG